MFFYECALNENENITTATRFQSNIRKRNKCKGYIEQLTVLATYSVVTCRRYSNNSR